MDNSELLSWPTSALSEAGGRQNNQDYCDFYQIQETGCWIVADGLGGHSGGEEASRQLTASIFAEYIKNNDFSKAALESHLKKAQRSLQSLQQKKPEFSDMRSTLVILIRQDNQVLWAHVGDSRLYHFREGKITFQTKDHSVPQMLVVAGEIDSVQIRHHSDRNRLLRSVGEPGEIAATYLKQPFMTQPGDAFLLCSDGFWELVLETEMEEDFQHSDNPRAWLAAMEKRLKIKASGEFDNYTAMALFVN